MGGGAADAEAEAEVEAGRKESRRPPWSYWAADVQGKEKETRAERKVERGLVWGDDGGGRVGAAVVVSIS